MRHAFYLQLDVLETWMRIWPTQRFALGSLWINQCFILPIHRLQCDGGLASPSEKREPGTLIGLHVTAVPPTTALLRAYAKNTRRQIRFSARNLTQDPPSAAERTFLA